MSVDFPTRGQYQKRRNAYYDDAFVTKLKDTTIVVGQVTSDGATGLGGVTVTLTGSKDAAAVTDASGKYSFPNLPFGGDYTVTVYKSGLTFVPSKQSFTDLEVNQTHVNFRTRPAKISGRVTTGEAADAALGGVTMTLTGGANFTPRTVTTTSYGTYSFGNLPTPGRYKVTLSKTHYTFSPAQLTLVNLTTSRAGVDFTGTLKTHTVSGRVTLSGTTTGIHAVTITLTSRTPDGFSARTTQTSSPTGYYTFRNLPAGRNYTLKPAKTGFTFSPMTRSIINLSDDAPAGTSTDFAGTRP